MEIYVLNSIGIRPWEIEKLAPQDKNDLLGMRELQNERDEYERDKSKGKGNVAHIGKKNRKTI